MIKMAEVYFGEDHLEAAYLLYMKYVTLHIEKLPRCCRRNLVANLNQA